MNSSGIRYIKRNEINDEKWDECVSNAENSRIYSNIFHLDRTAIFWDAFIYEDYKYVMPVPIRKKFGIKYVYHPLFSQQLGIFPNPPSEIARQFYLALYQQFKFVDTQLNSENQNVKSEPDIDFINRQNYLLNLSSDYNSIRTEYSKNTKRNLSKAAKNKLSFVAGISLEDYLHFKTENVKGNVQKKDLEKLKSIIAFGQFRSIGQIYGVYSSTNQLCAAVYFCRWKNRIIYMNAASDSIGKELGAMSFLVDNFIQQNSGKDFILDFEGSTVPGLARFYSGFGANPENYFQLKINRLPLPFRWVKK